MKQKSTTFVILVLIFCVFLAGADKTFSQQVLSHIERLCAIGPRTAGSYQEKQAARYIQQQFFKLGLDTSLEPFEFTVFSITESGFFLGNRKYTVEHLGLDPYAGKLRFCGEALIYSPGTELKPAEVKGKVVVTRSAANFFRLMALGAKAAVYLSDEDFSDAVQSNQKNFSLEIHGEFRKMTSANISARLTAPVNTEREIIVSAHYDTYGKSPGANDNATGVGALIELARLFKKNKSRLLTNLTFVAFGGEETGLLGSRMYLRKHRHELNRTLMLFNIDTVGGKGKICVETMGGVSAPLRSGKTAGFPPHLTDKGWEGPYGRWRIMSDAVFFPLTLSNVPDWLMHALEAAAEKENIDISPSRMLFSDLRTFAQAGIPATGVAQKTGSPILHTAADTIEKINPLQIEEAGKLCFATVMRIMKARELK